MTTTTFTIDCDTCPGRGRLCGDCFVPVLGKVWLQEPAVRRADRPTHPSRARPAPPETEGSSAHAHDHRPETERPGRVALDSDELAAVSAFVRAGLVDPGEAAQARAQLTGSARFAAG